MQVYIEAATLVQVSTGALGQLLGDAARAQAISAVRGSGTGAPHLEEAANSIALSDAELKAVRCMPSIDRMVQMKYIVGGSHLRCTLRR